MRSAGQTHCWLIRPLWSVGGCDGEVVEVEAVAGVGRILLGVPDLENEDAFAMLEDIAGGIGLG